MKKCDVVLPLVAIATPATYVKEPLRVFDLDFEENLAVVRQCVKYGKRLIFPPPRRSTACAPTRSSKRTRARSWSGPSISSAGSTASRSSSSTASSGPTAFRKGFASPFSGPSTGSARSSTTSTLEPEKEGSSRVVTQFISNLIHGEPIRLVDGGEQKRCFTYVDDGIDGLMRIIENKNDVCNGEIFNIGNPRNEATIKELA